MAATLERLLSAAKLPLFPEPPYQNAYPCILPDGDYGASSRRIL